MLLFLTLLYVRVCLYSYERLREFASLQRFVADPQRTKPGRRWHSYTAWCHLPGGKTLTFISTCEHGRVRVLIGAVGDIADYHH